MSKDNHTKKQVVKPEKAQGKLIFTSEINNTKKGDESGWKDSVQQVGAKPI